MATKKPRKREYIPPVHEVLNKKESTPRAARGGAATSRGRSGGGARQHRVPPEPSLRRTLRRLPVYFAILLALQYFLVDEEAAKKLSTWQRLNLSAMYAAVVTLAFAPFMYWMEKWSYRMQMKRLQRDKPKA